MVAENRNAELVKRYRDDLKRDGIREDSRLFPHLVTMYEVGKEASAAAKAAESAVRDGARGLTPEGEKQLVERVARSIGDAAEGLIKRRTHRLDWKISLFASVALAVCMAASAGAGYWIGYRAGAVEAVGMSNQFTELAGSDPAAAKRWLRVMRQWIERGEKLG